MRHRFWSNGVRISAQHRQCPMTIGRPFHRSTSLDKQSGSSEDNHVDVDELLSRPTWSVASLLPTSEISSETPKVTSKQLRHLLRLSALPPPKNEEQEKEMLSTLSSQLHFVKEIQKVDTTGVEPLRSIRDETVQGEKDAEIGMETLKDAFAQEEIRGKHHKRIRRRRAPVERKPEDEWDPLATAGKKVGRFFVVEGGKDR